MRAKGRNSTLSRATPRCSAMLPDTAWWAVDETCRLLDRAFDQHPVVLLHAYAGRERPPRRSNSRCWYASVPAGLVSPIVLFIR